MPHRFVDTPSGIVLSSTLPDFEISVDGEFVDVVLTAPDNIDIFSERLYAYGGRVVVYDLGSLVEAHMRSLGICYASFTLKLLDAHSVVVDDCSLDILYCDRFDVGSDIDLFLTENFLTTLAHRRIAPGAGASMHLYALAGSRVAPLLRYRADVAGQLYVGEISLPIQNFAQSGVYQLNVDTSVIFDDVALNAHVEPHEVQLLSFTISADQRSVTFYVDHSLRVEDCFVFRNCFNAWDSVYIPITTTAKTKVDRSLAALGSQSQFYDQSVDKKYEVESGLLTSDEAEWIDQLFSSYEVMRYVKTPCNYSQQFALQPVLITESTCEISDGDEKPNSVKFTWRFADNRPIVHLSASPGIFSSPYNNIFS